MRRTRVLWEVYVTRFEQALDGYKQRRLSAEESGRAARSVGSALPPSVCAVGGGGDR